MASDSKDAGDPPQLVDPDMFLFWKKRFQVFVQANYHFSIWIHIEFAQNITSPSGKRYNFEATNLLYRAIPNKLFGIIYKCQTAHDIWTTLDMTYGGSHSKIDSLTQEFETFKMLPDENIETMLRRYNIVISSLKNVGVTYTTERYVAIVLSGLPPWNDLVKTTIQERKDFCLLCLDDLLEPLRCCEKLMFKRSNYCI